MLAKEGDEAVERGADAVTSQYLKEGRDEHAMGGKCEHFVVVRVYTKRDEGENR